MAHRLGDPGYCYGNIGCHTCHPEIIEGMLKRAKAMKPPQFAFVRRDGGAVWLIPYGQTTEADRCSHFFRWENPLNTVPPDEGRVDLGSYLADYWSKRTPNEPDAEEKESRG